MGSELLVTKENAMTKTTQQQQATTNSRPTRKTTQKVFVSGATGLVGKALMSKLAERNLPVNRLVRTRPGMGDVLWDPANGKLDASHLQSDAVVHLAGESIAEGRWTDSKMKAIRNSRVEGTRLLCERLASLPVPPSVLVCASAIGYYGDRGDEMLSEDSKAGDGFLPDVCQEWEQATQPARDAGIRVVNLRIGVVLAREGGALSKMRMPFKMGVGGKIGSGSQWMSWISLTDLVSIICKAIDDPTIEGPVNAVAPQAVTNLEFTKALGKALRRPTIAPLPAFAARLALGKMADALLLASIRVTPKKLLDAGFEFEHPSIDEGIASVLGAKS